MARRKKKRIVPILLKKADLLSLLLDPSRKRKKTSEEQAENEDRFREATNYAKWQITIPEAKADYAKKIASHQRSAHHVALNDYLNPPVVHYVKVTAYRGTVGERITIKATDDFRVTEVEVTIISGNGKELEQGYAERMRYKPSFWHYHTTRDNPVTKGTVIKVCAKDKPGNETEGELRVGDVRIKY